MWLFFSAYALGCYLQKAKCSHDCKVPPVYITVLIRSELSQHSITISDGPPVYSIIVLIQSELSQHSITVSNGLNLHCECEGYRLKSMTCVWLFHVC